MRDPVEERLQSLCNEAASKTRRNYLNLSER